MKTEPIVSVIMPVFNCVSYVEDAIKSILEQTFTDFELIIIDDGSTDGTTDIIKKFIDPRVKVIFKDINQGVSAATNDGFRLAKGKYIARMDGDDISVKKRFEKQVEVLENNPKIFICGSFVQYLGGTNNIVHFKEMHQEIISELLLYCSICMGASMFRRKELLGHFYDEKKHSGEDYDFWSRVAWLGEVYNIQEVLLFYRVHSGQASVLHKKNQIEDDVKIRLGLFKKINYDTIKYPDDLITKMLLLNQSISVRDFKLFLKWIEALKKRNFQSKIYPDREFGEVLVRIRRVLIFSLYFKKTDVGITKRWRLQAFIKLPISDAIYVSQLKGKEIRKRIFGF